MRAILLVILSSLGAMGLTSCGDSWVGEGEEASAAEVLQLQFAAEKPTDSEGAYQQVCMNCHGDRGQGNEALNSPSIAGLPTWYIEEQLRKFREGQRGAHGQDTMGQQMRAIAMSLTDAQIVEAVRTISEFEVILTELPPNEANLAKGRYIFANECMECHRFNGKGEVVFHSAQLVSLNRSYLRRQLDHFHRGVRGSHPDDFYGNKMVLVTSHLSDEDIDALVDYIGVLAHGDDPRPARER
ncbi:MAG: c-type cytochrome [Verrucomicrobiota bacterium]